MSTTATPIFPQTIACTFYQFTNSTGTTIESFWTGSANGMVINSIIVTSTDTVARDLLLYFTVGATNYLFGSVSIPAGAGNAGNPATIPSVNLLGSSQLPGIARDSNGNPFLQVPAGQVFSLAMGTTITSGKLVNVTALGGYF